MKRKRLDRDIWTRITVKRYVQKQIRKDTFDGIVSVLYIDEVSSPSRWKLPDEEITICDKGMKWLQILPADEYYLITAMMDRGKILLWYIDIIAGQGLDGDGVPFYDDLYLDLVVRPNKAILIDDMDELEDALNDKDITQELFQLALNTKEKLENGILKDVPALRDFCLGLLAEVEKGES